MNITATSTETRLYRSGAKCLVQNLGPGAIYLGLSAGVTAASGLKLDVFDAIEIPASTSGSIYIVSDGTADVRVLGGAVEDLYPAPVVPVTYDVTSLDFLSLYSQGQFNTAFALNSAPTADVTVTLSNFQASDADVTINAVNLTGTIAAGATAVDITNFFIVNAGGDDKATYTVDWALSSADANWDGQTGTHTGSTLGFAAPFVSSAPLVEGTSGAIDASVNFGAFPTSANITITGGSTSDSRVTVNNTGQVIPSGTTGSVVLTGLFSVTDDGVDQLTETDSVWVEITATADGADANVVEGVFSGQSMVLYDNPVLVVDIFGSFFPSAANYYQIIPGIGNTVTADFALGYTPSDDVVINLVSSDPAVATVSPATLTFTTGNFATPQTVTFTSATATDGAFSEITATVDATSVDTSRVGHLDKFTVWVESF